MTDSYAVIAVVVVLVLLALGWRWFDLRLKRQKKEAAAVRPQDLADLRTKRKLDTALRELRDLKDALPPADQLRVERRRPGGQPPSGQPERRKSRVRR